ncbi:MAG TPA: nitrite reductase small subunit NirD [Mycobacteriales bacterium]|nr:nitrite reductase small subunit NirD [Mycobacteriales bacterium]
MTNATRPAEPTVVESDRSSTRWTAVCRYDGLQPERGACALLGGGQVAVFRLWDGSVRAVSNYDPFTGAFVLSRGIVGTRGDVPVVFSPMLKHAFDLCSGAALDDPAVRLAVYPVRVRDGWVEVAAEVTPAVSPAVASPAVASPAAAGS